jgi:hypothetical protein
MWRILIAGTLIYGSGHPNLDGYRPEPLDRPLQMFHQEVNNAARDGKMAITYLDANYLGNYVARIEARLRDPN